LVGVVGALVTVAFACGDVGDRYPAPPPYTGTGGNVFQPPGPCEDGDTRDCHQVLGQQGSVVSCYDGTQTCSDGVWGECIDGTVRVTPAPAQLPQPYTFADAGGCGNNPCDPTCQVFGVDAGPDGDSLTIPQNSAGATWTTGSISSLASAPGGLVKKGLLPNCTSAYDCQFDFKCTNPAVASCTHSKCATGAALTAGCDPPQSTGPTGCVAEICAAGKDPACCKAPFSLTGCSKTPCTAGGGAPLGCLDVTLAAVITSVTTGTPSCLTNWTQACVDKYRKLSGAGCGWDAQCVKEVGTICGVDCAEDDGSGVCVPRLANEKDPNCSGVDLTLGIPCDDGIPVCNHGQADLPSQQIRLWFYPANSGHIPAGSPTGSPSPTECLVTKAIPAGKCVNVSTTECPFNGTNKEIIVNPQNGSSPAPIAECFSDNNWTLYSGGAACGAPVCAGAAVATTQVPINMYVLLDRSGSMGDKPPNPPGNTLTKFQIVKAALTTFFDDPEAAGTHIYFRGFPDVSESSPAGKACIDQNATCNATNQATEVTACATPQKITTLPDATLDSYVNGLTNTSHGTPSYIALAGGVQWGINYKMAHPSEAVAVVYVTDGAPSSGGCSTKAWDAAAAAASAKAAGVPVFALGMYDTNASQTAKDFLYLDPVASAGAGVASGSDAKTCSSSADCGGGTCVSCNKQNQNCSSDTDCCAGYGSCVSGKCTYGSVTSACRGTAINASAVSSDAIAQALLSIKKKLTSCTMGIGACKGGGAACTSNADCCSSACSGGVCVGGQAGFNPASASLVYTDNSGNSTVEPYQTSAAGCSGTANDGWYYDNPSAPANVTLCPKTCSAVQADSSPQVNLMLGCPPYGDTVITLQYEASCPAGTNAQWAYMGYDATTPSDSLIEVYGQYGGTTADLCSISTLADLTACTTLTKLATPSAKGGVQACTAADASTTCPSQQCATNGKCTDPQVCDTGSGFPGCPVDLFNKMNTPIGAAANYFQLVLKLKSSADGTQAPVMNNINLSYSCPPSD
jgi:hypothetical protein